jgi:hypothetical protein
MNDAQRAAEIARIEQEIRVIEGRLIAARHLRLADRVRLLESELRRLRSRRAELADGSRDVDA